MEKLTQKVEEIVTELNYYLYDMEYVTEHGDKILRIMIENEGVIDIDDCIKVSHAVSEYLDEYDPFTDPYNLEVTSAGAERELKTSDHIKRAVGKYVYIETVEQKLYGDLIGYKEGFVEIKQKNGRKTKINEIDANLIRLAIKF